MEEGKKPDWYLYFEEHEPLRLKIILADLKKHIIDEIHAENLWRYATGQDIIRRDRRH